MDGPDLFKNFKIDIWYKAVMYFGGIVFVISLFSTVQETIRQSNQE